MSLRSKHTAHVEVILYLAGKTIAVHRISVLSVDTVILFVKSIAKLFEQNHGVTVYAGMLTAGSHFVKYGVYICHVEITAHEQIS